MANQEYGTVLGPDAVFKGELSFDSGAKVLGTFEGSITSKGKVLIASGSACKATITAKEVAVEGVIEGNVEASDRLELMANCRITGDIVAGKMVMADGASIDGYCRIGMNGAAPKSGGTKATATTETKPVTADAKATAKS